MQRRLAMVTWVVVLSAACSGGGGGQTPRPDAPTSPTSRPEETPPMQLTSSAFTDGGAMPALYTCDGTDVSPPLRITNIPATAETLALVVEDPDAPRGTWDHWVAFDIPVVEDIPQGVAELGTPGRNSWGRRGYGGPCPPSGTHRYVFAVYAVDTRLDLRAGAAKADVLRAMEGHVLASAQLVGRYSR